MRIRRLLILLLFAAAPLHAQDLQMQLTEAAMRGDSAELRTLLASGAKVDDTNDSQRTALAYAAAQGSPAAVQVLIDAGAAVNAHDVNGLTPLMMAAAGGHTPVVELLIAKGADARAAELP